MQAAMLAYLGDFRLLAFAAVAGLPLLLLVKRNEGGEPVDVAMAAE
jgi:hypothetical protein